MVYEWIDSNNQKKQLFKNFIKELNEILMFDSQIQNKKTDLKAKLYSMEKILKDFSKLFNNEKDKLKIYQETSIEAIDYIKNIDEDILLLNNALNEIENNLNSPIYLKKLLTDVSIFANELEINIKAMQEQAKESLEILYKKKENQIKIDDFISLTKKLGGKINNNHGHGDHFYVEFALFNHLMAPSKNNNNEISIYSINSFVEENIHRIEKYLNPKYLKYFYFEDDEKFRKIFIHKYKKFFQLEFSKE
ncbi:MAG: hypothetical protein PHT94_04100 [Candidatus Nanoarchaeia archaeon]|nr:hypothetical protein [Candidatus Nanoarchaeia archaeon]